MTMAIGNGVSARQVLVIGLGNPDRGDDGIGIHVTRKLCGRLNGDVAIRSRSGDMLRLIDDWAGFDAIICVDAAAPMGSPGRIHRIDIATEDLPRHLSVTSSHAFGLADALALARSLRLAPRDIIVYAVEGCSFEGGASLTAAVSMAAGEVVDRIVVEVERLRDVKTETYAPRHLLDQ